MNRCRQATLEEGPVKRDAFSPRIEPHVDLGLAVEESAGNEITCRGDKIDLVAIGGVPLHAIDRAREHPRMPPEEGLGTFGLQDDFGRHDDLDKQNEPEALATGIALTPAGRSPTPAALARCR